MTRARAGRGLLYAMMLIASAARAQDSVAGARPPQGDLPPVFKNTLRGIGKLFSGPVHLVIDGVASGGGIAGGIGIGVDPKGPFKVSTKALYSIKEYWVVEGVVGYIGRRATLEGYGRLRDMPQVRFYGLGEESSIDDRTNFALREGLVGAHGTFRLLPGVTLLGRAEHYSPEVSPGEATKYPSIETRFVTDSEAPGLLKQPPFFRYEAGLELGVPASVGNGFFQGTRARAMYSIWRDQELDKYDFTRLDIEAQQRFASFIPNHRLTLHGWMSTTETDDGQQVPFYLQRTLGSKGQLKSVHEYLLGGDGTQATLRGYDSFRFRGRHLVLVQAEYRLPIWGPFDATVFYDAGKVTMERSDLDLNGLKDNYGFSVSLMRENRTAARIDVGLGGEGKQIMFSISSK
jgi:hypothetical protein